MFKDVKKALVLFILAHAAFFCFAQNSAPAKEEIKFAKGNINDKIAAVKSSGDSALAKKAVDFVVENALLLKGDRDLAGLAVAGILSYPVEESKKNPHAVLQDFSDVFYGVDDINVRVSVLEKIAAIYAQKEDTDWTAFVNGYLSQKLAGGGSADETVKKSISTLGVVGNGSSFNILYSILRKPIWSELDKDVSASLAKIADKVSGVFVPAVIAIAAATLFAWLFAGRDFGFALARAISVLVISCPCALGLATPVAIMVANGVAAKNGILFKTAAALEEAGKIKVAALDKTGTITQGQPRVTDIFCAQGVEKQELLEAALDVEQNSEHPLSKAILERAKESGLVARPVTNFAALAGHGVKALSSDGQELLAGSVDFIAELLQAQNIAAALDAAQEFSAQGKTPLAFARGKKLLGVIAVSDTIKEDSAAAIRDLRSLGIKTVMLTGDNQKTAAFIAGLAGVDQTLAGLLPDQKAAAIESLKKEGKVAMVGDGINDAVALTAADIGVAIGAGTDVAIDAADIVLAKNSLSDVATAIRLSRAALRNIKQNLFWAFFYNALGIPLAAGAWIWLLGWKMNPMFGAAAMSLSSFCVVTNALRLNFFRAKNSRNAGKEKNMTKTIKIEGLMCGHCDARVKKALEAVPGVASANADHEKGQAVVELSADVGDDALKAAVEAQDYKVLGID